MERLGAREEHILDFMIRDYVRNAVPISSGRICRAGGFRLSPATVRNVMLELDERGFLEQPHTSSGRMPTDQAYRYFVDHLMALRAPAKKEREVLDGLVKEVKTRHELFFEDFAKILSRALGLFTGIASFKEHFKMEGFGLEQVFSEPEFYDRNLTVEFSHLIDNLEEVARDFLDRSSETRPASFIGGENSPEAKEFGAVTMKFSDNEFGTCIVFSLGPKRMNYEKATSFINFVVKDLIR